MKSNTDQNIVLFCWSGRIIVYFLGFNMLTFFKIIFHLCSSVLLQSSFQKAFQTSFHVLLQTWKPDLQILNYQQLLKNVTTAVIFSTHSTTLFIPMFNMYRWTLH